MPSHLLKWQNLLGRITDHQKDVLPLQRAQDLNLLLQKISRRESKRQLLQTLKRKEITWRKKNPERNGIKKKKTHQMADANITKFIRNLTCKELLVQDQKEMERKQLMWLVYALQSSVFDLSLIDV